ncbi:thioredoxin family protein [Candidatus Dependentiae bacterium]
MKRFLFMLLFLIPSCISSVKEEGDEKASAITNLVESTRIIRTLVSQNKLGDILEEHDPEKLSLLLDNVCPAKMAFESEVFSTTMPLVVVYYFKESPESRDFIEQLESLAVKYDNHVKFAVVDVERLFSLAQDADIERIPTLLFVQNRKIIDRLEGAVDIKLIEQKLKDYF